MPVMDGFEFRRAQRSDPTVAKVPTVVISALHKVRERVADLVVDEVLEKPIQLQQLLQVVERYCGQSGTA
jgi:CheY-like chemotaxis protein